MSEIYSDAFRAVTKLRAAMTEIRSCLVNEKERFPKTLAIIDEAMADSDCERRKGMDQPFLSPLGERRYFMRNSPMEANCPMDRRALRHERP